MSFRSKVSAAYAVEAYSSSVERLTRKFLKKFFPDQDLPMPKFKLVQNADPKWLGRTLYDPDYPETTTIYLQKSVLNDETTLERVLIHELIHHADFLINGSKPDTRTRKGHGKFFQEMERKVNSYLGKDFITDESDVTYQTETSKKEFYVLIVPFAHRFGWAYAENPTSEQKEIIKDMIKNKDAKVIKTKDAKFLAGAVIKEFGGFSIPRGKEFQDYLAKLYKSGKTF